MPYGSAVESAEDRHATTPDLESMTKWADYLDDVLEIKRREELRELYAELRRDANEWDTYPDGPPS